MLRARDVPGRHRRLFEIGRAGLAWWPSAVAR